MARQEEGQQMQGQVHCRARDDIVLTLTLPDPDGPGGPLVSAVYSYQYDAAGRLIKETDPAGNVTEYQYDLNDNLVALRLPDPVTAGGAGGPIFTYTFDPLGNAGDHGRSDCPSTA